MSFSPTLPTYPSILLVLHKSKSAMFMFTQLPGHRDRQVRSGNILIVLQRHPARPVLLTDLMGGSNLQFEQLVITRYDLMSQFSFANSGGRSGDVKYPAVRERNVKINIALIWADGSRDIGEVVMFPQNCKYLHQESC